MPTALKLLFLLPFSSAFLYSTTSSANPPLPSCFTQKQQHAELNLVPLSNYASDLTFFAEPEDYRCCIDTKGNFIDGEEVYELNLVEEGDLPDLCRFVVSTFGADAIRLSQDINSFEKLLMTPAAEFMNGYSSLVAFAEVFSGTKQRLSERFHKMDLSRPTLDGLTRQEKIEKVEKDSLILALAQRRESKLVIIASIELRLQPCDAKIPFSLPWLDRIERKVASSIGLGDGTGRDLQPYLSNLCVDETFRGRRIGRALVRCVENIAKTTWGYNRIYLHVDEGNAPALNLYRSENYKDVGHRWNPFWAGSAAEIGYYVKTMQGPKSTKKQ